MDYSFSFPSHEKLALVWAARRERLIAVRVEYDVVESGGCRIYQLSLLQEI
jgi:hypothetical protein